MNKIWVLIVLILSFSCKQNTTTSKKNISKAVKDTVITSSKKQHKPIKLPYLKKDFLLGKFDYKKHEEFEKIKSIHTSRTIYLNKEAYKAFTQMFNAAKSDHISLKIISGTRNFNQQKGIWERKWEKYKTLQPLKRAKKILEYSSMPTTSRHHWGTDIDINNLNNSYFEKGTGKKEYEWLVKNANTYGFYQVYTSKENGRTGYNLEKWHWSYLPLASKYLEYYNKHITYKDIIGFKGAKFAKQANMIKDYVNGIAHKAKLYQ